MTLSLEEAFNRFVRSKRRANSGEQKRKSGQRKRNRKRLRRTGWRVFERKRYLIEFSIHITRPILVEGNRVSWIYQDRKALENERRKTVSRKPKGYKKHNNVTFDFTDLHPRQELMFGSYWYFIADNQWDKKPIDRLWLQFGSYKHIRDDCFCQMVQQSKKAIRHGVALFQRENPYFLPHYLWDDIVSLLIG